MAKIRQIENCPLFAILRNGRFLLLTCDVDVEDELFSKDLTGKTVASISTELFKRGYDVESLSIDESRMHYASLQEMGWDQMKYETILENGSYALIIRGVRMEEYAVVNGLNKETGDWSFTCAYWNFGEYSGLTQAEALSYALDFFRSRTEENYISRSRLEELATQFKDGLIEVDEEFANEYFDEVCEMTDEEKEWFGIEPERKGD